MPPKKDQAAEDAVVRLVARIRLQHCRMLLDDSHATQDDAARVVYAQIASEERAAAKAAREKAKGPYQYAPIRKV